MKLRIYSDLHLDWYEKCLSQTRLADTPLGHLFWMPPVLPDDKETTLILAGDLWIGTEWIESLYGYSWIGHVAPRFKKVLVILGNHDYWPSGNLTILNGAEKCNNMLYDRGHHNVKVLDMDTYIDGEYLFVGATLWTDMNKNDPLAMHRMPSFMSYDGKIAYDTGPNGAWTRFTSEKWVETHQKHRDYIKHIVAQNKDKKIIVLTHHLPLESVIDPQYHGQSSNAYYASDLSDLILDNDHIKLWAFGHTHHTIDTMFPSYAENDGCRLINRAVGYQGEHREQLGLVLHDIIEV